MEVFALEIYTPYRLFYRGEVESVVVTLIDGDAGVYANHAPFTAPVTTGILTFKDKKGDGKYAVISEGIIEVKKRKAVILADSANWPEEIDKDRALAAKAESEKIINESNFKLDAEKAHKKLKRAQMRLKLLEILATTAPSGNYGQR
ncbi:MAG: ATP synthase F1 subunit epsilon [Spirochaetaceae bacterium]|jgi:F-type H+-transporting ATPase subunit epsilon|nr:ATP synthase F1 subunit epsilon [Spirochaetaceae bacterium]